jgi:hypothetical protein
LGNLLIIRLPNYDKSREHVESEGYITLKKKKKKEKKVVFIPIKLVFAQ